VDVTVGGYAGQSITLHVPDDAVFTQCDQATFGSWTVPAEAQGTFPARFHQGPGQIDELWILEVDGVLTVIDTAYYVNTPVEHVEAMWAIVESATFESSWLIASWTDARAARRGPASLRRPATASTTKESRSRRGSGFCGAARRRSRWRLRCASWADSWPVRRKRAPSSV
jgi:hypothetical protein